MRDGGREELMNNAAEEGKDGKREGGREGGIDFQVPLHTGTHHEITQ